MQDMVAIIQEVQGAKSRTAFAKELGIHPATLSLIYHGKRGAGKDVVCKLIAYRPAMADSLIAAFFCLVN